MRGVGTAALPGCRRASKAQAAAGRQRVAIVISGYPFSLEPVENSCAYTFVLVMVLSPASPLLVPISRLSVGGGGAVVAVTMAVLTLRSGPSSYPALSWNVTSTWIWLPAPASLTL